LAEDDIISFQFDVGFDTATLEYTGFTMTGTLSDGGTAVVNAGIGGKLTVGYMNTGPLVGSGDIIRLQFTALLPDTTELFLSNAFLNAVPVVDLTHGTVIISEIEPPTAVISYSDSLNRFADTLIITATFSEAMSAAVPVRLNLDGAVTLVDEDMTRVSEILYTYSYQIPKASGQVQLSLSNGTDLWGNALVPTPTAGGTFTIIEFLPGDVNDDGVILAYDAALALQYSVGIDPLPQDDPLPWEPWRDSTANVDGIAGITANDAGLILQYSAGIISAFPSEPLAPAAMAYVSYELVDDHMILYSHGELLGLNINTTNEQGILGTPEVLNGSFISALNITGPEYRIGLCTATSAPEGEAVLKIPVKHSGTVTFHLIENTNVRELTVNLVTGIKEDMAGGISLYPNPVDDLLKVSGLVAPSTLRINNIHGQELFSARGQGETMELNLGEVPPGIYLLTVETGGEIFTRRLIVK
jgi:hypothetical protein